LLASSMGPATTTAGSAVSTNIVVSVVLSSFTTVS
jgi:hypothetical protein